VSDSAGDAARGAAVPARRLSGRRAGVGGSALDASAGVPGGESSMIEGSSIPMIGALAVRARRTSCAGRQCWGHRLDWRGLTFRGAGMSSSAGGGDASRGGAGAAEGVAARRRSGLRAGAASASGSSSGAIVSGGFDGSSGYVLGTMSGSGDSSRPAATAL
jgi:hypothetical protein